MYKCWVPCTGEMGGGTWAAVQRRNEQCFTCHVFSLCLLPCADAASCLYCTWHSQFLVVSAGVTNTTPHLLLLLLLLLLCCLFNLPAGMSAAAPCTVCSVCVASRRMTRTSSACLTRLPLRSGGCWTWSR
jgi:hypothetical protein